MEPLFPSEIARLVLGYLKEDCPEAATMFEAKSLHLIEYRLLALQNKNPRTTVNGMALISILNQHNTVVGYIQKKLKELTRSQTVSNSGDLIENLETIIKTISKSDRNEVSVVYENITPRQDNFPSENVKRMKLDINVEKKPDTTVKYENIKNEKLTKKQESKLVHLFRTKSRISSTVKSDLAEEFDVSKRVIESFIEKLKDGFKEQSIQLRRRYTHCGDSGDSENPAYEPRPSTSRAADENDMNCSSSSQREKLRSSEIEKDNSSD